VSYKLRISHDYPGDLSGAIAKGAVSSGHGGKAANCHRNADHQALWPLNARFATRGGGHQGPQRIEKIEPERVVNDDQE